ncbi:MAG TPA: FHA domain-containing protein, partial [Pyrinomonadaceae bacterium]|nr:FHA domain-containing protein [Pyrinomonadaceae bacterium]
MRIVLAEERNGQRRPERAFDRATVKIGRDPSECQVIFDQAEWPMVSRKHAEFRLKDGGCLLVDTNSSFGTFLNGQRITEPVEVQAGSRVQFGAGGPVMLVVSIDVAQPARAGAPAASFSEMETYRDMGGSVQALEQAKITPTAPQQRPAPPPPAQVAPPAPPAPAQPATIEVVSSMTGKLERIQINKEVMRLGRDPGMDVEIEAAAAVVSRRHAEIRRHNGQFVLVDLGSFNGTLLNDQRITTPMPLHHGDRIQLGMGGPILRFLDPAHPAPAGAHGAGQLSPAQALVSGPPAEAPGMHTMVVPSGSGPLPPQASAGAGSQPQLLLQRQFAGRPHLTVGRAPDSDIRLDGLQISNRHARLLNAGGQVFIEDIGSTNGVYVNGARISGRRPIQARDVVQVGPFLIHADAQHGVAVFDTRSKTRIDVIDITKIVPNRSGGGTIKLLDDVDLTIQPNEFVGLLGPSGAGKSTLMDSLNGMRPATKGQVLINNLDLYQHLDSLKQSIGYVPQDDIIHRELTVYRTLYYVARLRLSRDVSAQEIDQIVNEVMDVTGLSERRDVPVGQ